MALFHSCPVLLDVGSLILPGNYGRIILETGDSHSLWFREQALELVRQQRFPGKPSRFSSCFCCTSLETARFYMSVPARQGRIGMLPVLYEVEKADPAAIEHIADFNVVQPLPGRSETMEQIAIRYWEASLWVAIADAPGIRCEELVTSSPLRVVQRL